MQHRIRRAAAVAWASFLVAATLEMAVFAFVDPQTLHTLAGSGLDASPLAVYTVAFFGFWVAAAVAAALTLLLDGSAEELNARPLADSRPSS